jgi:AcrR family transcriptional regulator
MAESGKTSRTEQRRRDILTAAQTVFDAKGFDIAAEAGLAKGSVYNYFDNKEDLFAQAFEQLMVMEDLQGAEALLVSPASATEKYLAYLDMFLESIDRFVRISGLVLEFWAASARQQQDSGAWAMFKATHAKGIEIMQKIVEQGIASGEFRPMPDTRMAAHILNAVTDGIMIDSVMGLGLPFTDEFKSSFKRGMLASIAPIDSDGESDHD